MSKLNLQGQLQNLQSELLSINENQDSKFQESHRSYEELISQLKQELVDIKEQHDTSSQMAQSEEARLLSIISDLQKIAANNPAITLLLTEYGGHVGYVSSKHCQHEYGDRDRWWAWNRVFEWIEQVSTALSLKCCH